MEVFQRALRKGRSRSSRPALLRPWVLVAGLVWLTVVGLGGAGFLHVHLGSGDSGDRVHGHFFLDRQHDHAAGEGSHSHPHPHSHPHSHGHSEDEPHGPASDEAPSDEPLSSDSGPAISLAPVASASSVPVTLPATSPVYQPLVLGAEQDFLAPDLLPSRNPRAPPRRSFSPTAC